MMEIWIFNVCEHRRTPGTFQKIQMGWNSVKLRSFAFILTAEVLGKGSCLPKWHEGQERYEGITQSATKEELPSLPRNEKSGSFASTASQNSHTVSPREVSENQTKWIILDCKMTKAFRRTADSDSTQEAAGSLWCFVVVSSGKTNKPKSLYH